MGTTEGVVELPIAALELVETRQLLETRTLLAELQSMRARADAIVAHSHDLVMFFEADGTIVSASPASLSLFGMDPEQLIGRNGFEMIHPDDQERVLGEFMQVRELGDFVRTEFRIINAHGQTRWVEEVATNLVDDPDVGLVVGNLRDITSRVEAEQAVRFQARLLAAVGQALVAIDNERVIVYWNGAAEQIYGWCAEEVLGRPIAEVVLPGEGWESKVQELRAGSVNGSSWSGEFWVRTKHGVTMPVMATNTPVFDDDGARVGTIGVSSDITERLRNEESVGRLSSIVESSGDAIFSAGRDGIITTWNAGASALFARSEREMIGRHLDEVLPGGRTDGLGDVFTRILRGDAVQHFDAIGRRADGSELRMSISVSPIRSATDAIIGSSTIARDVSERHEAALALARQASQDPLTMLPNRASLNETLQALLSGEHRAGVAVAFLDVDQFKMINDRVGHAAGDEALKAVARRLRAALQPADVVARVGGDEFVLVRAGVESLTEAGELAAVAMEALRDPEHIGGHDFSLGASIGVTLSTDSDTPETLLRDADDAMYQAKEDGRARITVFDAPSKERARRRQSLAVQLPQALANDELHLEYQPIIELCSGRVAGFEALLRWTHPSFGAIRPDEFIPIAEATGLILSIGDWVLQQAISQLATWREESWGADVWMAINLSAHQLRQPQLVCRIADMIAGAGLDPGAVHLEITESALMDRVDDAHATLIELQRLGVRISIDDFGTGYSSLSYLSRLPIDVLKIDRSFVERLRADGHDASIVRAVTSLATNLGIKVVAEGVERPEQADVLRGLGCRYAQGFFWSRALVPSAARAWATRPSGS